MTSPDPVAPSSVLRSRVQDGVLRLTLCRPERRNALSSAAMRELLSAIEEADADETIGCVVLDAQGPVFSAGHDLKELIALRGTAAGDSEIAANCSEVFELCAQLMTAIVRSGTPTIAAVHGLATAAGCQLVASCDLAVAADNAAFATPGVDIGLFCSTPSVALSRNVSRKAAMEMLLLGSRVPADRALELGLVNRVVPTEQVDDVVLEMATTIASKPRSTVAKGKADFYRQLESGLEAAYVDMARAMAEGLLSEDADEGIGAFVEKRKPQWNAR